jgi:hypothetical protein
MAKQPDLERRRNAYRLYLRCRNLLQVSRELDIPSATLHAWKKQENWDAKISRDQELLTQARASIARAQQNAETAEQINELKLLDFLEGKVGELLVTEAISPTSWKDVLDTLKFVGHQRRLITGEPTENNVLETSSMKEKDLDDEILKLRRALAEAGSKVPVPAEITPAEIVPS